MGTNRRTTPQALTVEYTVTGALDGTTPAPPVEIDQGDADATPFDVESQVYRPAPVESLGLIDPALALRGSIGPRCIPFVTLDTEETGDPGAALDVVAARLGSGVDEVVFQRQIRDLGGVAGPVYIDEGFNVPQGSEIRLGGIAAGAEPIRVRVSILVPVTCLDLAAFRIPGVVLPAFLGMRNVGFVDPVSGNNATAAIGTFNPFSTIQAFLDAVPQATTAAEARNVYTAIISPADYDEDLAVDLTGKKIALTGPGSWNLGTFTASSWGPSAPRRNIVVTGSGANINGIRPGLAIGCYLPISEAMTTHESYLTKPRISGKLDMSAITGGSVELALTCQIFGDGGAPNVSIDGGAAILQSYMYHSRMGGRCVGSNWQFQVAQRCRFQGLIDVDNYSLFQSCRIDDGMTIASSGFAGIRPNGILLTNFDGLYTGGAGTFNCDAYTNWWQKTFNLPGVTIAQKTIQGDLAP